MSQAEMTLEEKLGYLRQFGSHAMAYSTLQYGLKTFGVSGIGYIAYIPYWIYNYVLADPICAPENKEKLVRAFIENIKHPVFVQISQDTGILLHKLGFYVNSFGLETDIDISGDYLKGKKYETLRRMANIAKRAGATAIEIPVEKVNKKRLEEISNEWVASKTSNRKELYFLARQAVFEPEPDVRKFFEFINDELVGFAFFSPLYKNNEIFGYYLDIHRHIRENPKNDPKAKGTKIKELRDKGIFGSPKGMSYYTTIEAIKIFQKEGKRMLALGLTPLYGAKDDLGIHSKYTKLLFQLLLKGTNWLYNFTGNYEFKRRWHGTEKQIYYATKEKVALLSFPLLYKLCRVF